MGKSPIEINKWFASLDNAIDALYKNTFRKDSGRLLSTRIDELVITNFTLWQYEDASRRKDVPDKDIADTKRNIDRENQKRHNITDEIDALLQKDIESKCKIDLSLPLNSETPGSVFDRLSILALRAYHLKKETKRKDVDESHIKRCSTMLEEVEERSMDLIKCLEGLLSDYYSGRKRLKSYKEHKLYNDPKLNPAIRKK